MYFLRNLKNNLLEYIINQWRMQHFGLSGFDYPFSTNQGTDEGVSGLVGSVLSAREKARILAKGGILVPLVKKLVFYGTDYVSLIPQKTLKMYVSSIVMRLRILHKCPHEPSLERLIAYHSTDGLVRDFAVDSKSGNVAVATKNFFEVRKQDSGKRILHSKTTSSSFSNRVAFGGGNNDSILAVCSDNHIRLYGGATLSCTQEMTSSATVNTVQFSPDGRVLVICLSNNTVQVLKKKDSDDGTEEWVCVETLEQTGEITSVAFYQQPEILILAIGLGDNTIKIWEMSSDETKPSSCVDTLAGHISWITSVSFHPYFKLLASGSNDKTVKVWRRNVDGQFICMLTLELCSPVSSVAFSPSGFLASGSTNDHCKIWRLIMSATCVNAELVLTKFVESGINQLNFCPITGNLLIRTYDGLITIE